MAKANKYTKLDKLWGIAIHLLDQECQYCGKWPINAHHIFTRDRKSTRFDIENGIGLCSYHHNWDKLISAHKAPKEFLEWLEEARGKEWLKGLQDRSHEIKQWTAVELYTLELHFKEYIELLKT